MTEALLKSLSIERTATLLSMETGCTHHTEHQGCDVQRHGIVLSRPPDINLPLAVEAISNSEQWGGGSKIADSALVDGSLHESPGGLTSSKGRRWIRRGDTIWGAWFFFNHYFRPVLADKCQNKMNRNGTMVGPLERSDLRLDLFLVQHDMENMYMWAFKERPENALGKMQLRSYMNGHARFGEPQFPFSADKGFSRSHRMQRKHYRGLSNPQCVHGVEVVRAPCLEDVGEEDRKRWMELTGRDLNFTIPPDAEAFTEWRNMNITDSGELDKSTHPSPCKPATGTSMKKNLATIRSSKLISESSITLNLTKSLANHNSDDYPGSSKKKRKGTSSNGPDADCGPSLSFLGEDTEQNSAPLWWRSNFVGAMSQASGPVTAAKTVYEDEKGYLVMVSLPFVDMQRLRVSWRNTATNGIVKIHCVSTARAPVLTRGERTFRLTDPNPEHCPPGDFVREIVLATRIPDNADLKAYYVEACAGLEIIVPKHNVFSEEREVRVFLPRQMNSSELLLSCHPA